MDKMCDYISRDDAKNALLNKGQHTTRYRLGETWELNFMEILEALDTIPTADVQPVKRGKWEYNDKPIFGNPYGRYCCSLCGSAMDSGEDNYCPCCGARMIKEGTKNE